MNFALLMKSPGAYFEGQSIGSKLARCIHGDHKECENTASYETIGGCATSKQDLSTANGWDFTNFLTWGFN